MLRESRRKSGKGQSALEYVVVLTILMGALLAGGVYFKRGIQGRWKSAVDDLGDQYDPRIMNTDIIDAVNGVTETRITTVDGPGGIWTLRQDQSNSTETRSGFTRTGAL